MNYPMTVVRSVIRRLRPSRETVTTLQLNAELGGALKDALEPIGGAPILVAGATIKAGSWVCIGSDGKVYAAKVSSQVRPVKQDKTNKKGRMKKKAVAVAVLVMASLMTTVSVRAAGWPLGTAFDKQLTVFQRINVTPETLKVVLVYNGGYLQPYGLDNGIWDTEASVNLYVHGANGTIVYYGAGITPYQPTIAFNDGHTVMGSATIQNHRLDIPIPVVGRDVRIDAPPNETRPLYIMLWIHLDQGHQGDLDTIQAYGFTATHKVRN